MHGPAGPAQHPSGHELPLHTHAPPTHANPSVHFGPFPHRQLPAALQWSLPVQSMSLLQAGGFMVPGGTHDWRATSHTMPPAQSLWSLQKPASAHAPPAPLAPGSQ